ncbi:iron-containing alcohol dehydrogenase [Streptosporangium jomthongense]|nr:iron-containing alcohol dehydrogenase [Streptosporangium jomthongense]
MFMGHDISALRKFVSPEIVFGAGSRKSVANFASNLGAKHVLLVSDPGVAAAGWVDEIVTLLTEAGIRTTVFTGVSANPRVDEVMAGAELYKSSECDVIVAIGGGSPMDCAKGIGIVASDDRHIVDFEGVDTIHNPPPPMILIPTTAGTSADVSQFAIISDPKRRFKFSIISKAIVPDVSLIDPEVTETMSSYLTACTGVDALVHAIEAYVSTGSGPLTDTHALQAIGLINRNLEPLVANTADTYLREQIMLASMQAGLAFSNAILGAVHAMSHSLGGFLDLPHGLCNAMLLEHVVAYNFGSADERFCRVAEAMGIDPRGMSKAQVQKRLVDRIIQLKRAVGLETKLSELGVSLSDIPSLSGFALQDPCILTNPRKSSLRDVQVVYEEAL